MSTLDKPRRRDATIVDFARASSGDSASWSSVAFLILAFALLAWTLTRLGGVPRSEWATASTLLAVSASALALSRRHFPLRIDASEAVLEEERHLAVAASVGGVVAMMRADGQVLKVHSDEDPDLGHAELDLMGAGYLDHVHIADRPAFLRALSEAAHSTETKCIVIRLRRGASAASGEPQPPSFAQVEVRIHALGSRDQVRGGREVVSVTRSMTRFCELESNLELARHEAQLSKTLKDRLLANVSHELRTPLNAILGFSEILGDANLAPADPSKRIEYARIIHSSADHLLSVVNQVLDMSRIEAGKFDIAPELFEIEPLIKDCCDMLRLKAENGRVSLIQDPLLEQLELVGDKRACRQILLNLLSNAVKFTLPDGSVVVGARRKGDEIHLHVSDTGIGIDPDHLSDLGNPFYQVRSSYNRTFEGAGLGLSLVRGLIGLHGGSILLETECGVGTRVTARLPLDCRIGRSQSSNATKIETVDTLRVPETAITASQNEVRGERKFA